MNETSKVLVVDDEHSMCDLLAEALPPFGFDVVVCGGFGEALGVLGTRPVDCVLTDLKLGGPGGLELCRAIAQDRDALPVVVLTAFGSLETAVGALRAGAFDFLTKPVDIAELAATLKRAVAHGRVRARLETDDDEPVGSEAPFTGLLGDSAIMQRLRRQLARIALTDTTVLLTGEAGTGKTAIARMLHKASRRHGGPFVIVECAGQPEAALEKQLFGEAGTGAARNQGAIVNAAGGTILLDDVGELPLALQARIVRVLQDRVVRPAGSDGPVPVDVRIVATTRINLAAAVTAGRFREDLHHRLEVIHLDVPPLRRRDDDVLVLAKRLIDEHAGRLGKPVTGLTPASAERMLAYSWPGNVRELADCIECAVALTEHASIGVDDLVDRVRVPAGEVGGVPTPAPGQNLPSLDQLERSHIMQVLDRVGGNKTVAARILGVDRKTLYRKLATYRTAS